MNLGHCDYALLPDGWHANVSLSVDKTGRWSAIATNVPRGECPRLGRYVIAGMPNLHSHAFQRAMAGSAERFSRPDDSFWSWREAMYQHAGRIDPQTLFAVARWLYVEMLEQGYTRVCEFHYVHHQSDGSPYAPAQRMSQALIAAADEAGIGLTLLPVLYQRGGFLDQSLAPRQHRFQHSVEQFMRLCETLAQHDLQPGMRLGAAMHSLRAVSADQLQRVLANPFWRERPIHIHIAEQQAEVLDCLAVHQRRPIERLFDLVDVDARYCLVHATHASDWERGLLAKSNAVVGICTTTEANLGDGVFDLSDLRARGGRWGIGSDSHIGLDPREELRWLEYQARLASGRRTVLADGACADVAANLWNEAVAGGAQACGAKAGGLQVGADADWLVLDECDPSLAAVQLENLMGSWVFAPARHAPSVGVGGRAITDCGRHPKREAFVAGYRDALLQLAGR